MLCGCLTVRFVGMQGCGNINIYGGCQWAQVHPGPVPHRRRPRSKVCHGEGTSMITNIMVPYVKDSYAYVKDCYVPETYHKS